MQANQKNTADSHDLLNKIVKSIEARNLQLPHLPDLAVKINRTIQDNQKSVEQIAKIIQVDPLLASKIISVSNSPIYRGAKNIEDCPSAVTRLGLEATRNLVTAFTLRQLFKGKIPIVHKQLKEIWEHSCTVGAICYFLASKISNVQPDKALLCGLVHDIGTLPILTYISEFPEYLKEPDVVSSITSELKGQLGAMLLKSWRFGDDFSDVALMAEDWLRDSGQPQIDYVDLIIVAQIYTLVGTDHAARLPTLNDIPAIEKFENLGIHAGDCMEYIDSAQREIKGILATLKT